MKLTALTIIVTLVFSSVAYSEVINGSFENGLDGLICSPDTLINTCNYETKQSLGNGLIKPTDGNFFLYAKTGPGDIGGDGLPDDVGILFKNITIEEGTETISFDFNFLTEMDTPSELGSDAIFISSQTIPNANFLVECDTKTNALTYIDDIAAVPPKRWIHIDEPFKPLAKEIVTVDGCRYTKQTGWHTVVLAVSELGRNNSGLNHYLAFEIQDGSQDRPYHSFLKDSALLIDNIRLAPDPEHKKNINLAPISGLLLNN
jgi:hypothetical protein